ncbi:MAG TPA: CHAT domain-containing tetratricopeptide repeat protein [Acetobacteraceae bacterium]|jgi:CHAT domain-containing protein
MRLWFAALIAIAVMSGCTDPPPSAYVGDAAGGGSGSTGLALGSNASGEQCRQLPSGTPDVADIYCGSWEQPAARIVAMPQSAGATPMAVATAGGWRQTLDLRFVCQAPAATSILGTEQAAVLQCTRRIGGWPQVALVAAINGRIYAADGIVPTLGVMQRAIGVQSGRIGAATVALPPSAADALLASQLAAHAFRAGDVGEYQRLMDVGARANLAENFATAETAYRAALALQQRVLGPRAPDTVDALISLALQLSDQGRFAEADALFAQAEPLAPAADDKAASARLLHYRALDALNQGQDTQALTLLNQAATRYAALVPPESLAANAAPASDSFIAMPDQRLMTDPTAQSALMGLIEVRRYQSVALRMLGRGQQSAAAIASAQDLANANRLNMPLVSARLTRTSATADVLLGEDSAAASGLSAARTDFDRIVPETRPVAETALLQAGVAVKRGDASRALALCGTGASLLRELRSGVDPTLLEPCLTTYAAEAARRPADRQALLRAMFETSELAQDSVTSREIDEAATRLAASARDPKVAQAIRRRQDASDHLALLYQQRDALAGGAPPGSLSPRAPQTAAALDKAIADAQADLADADSALQAAAPNYGQLVQQVVPAADVLRALRPGEALAAITLTRHGGWAFLLRDGTIDVAPVHGDTATMAALVEHVRASIESPSGKLPPFDTRDAHAIYTGTLGALAPRLVGVKSLVVAPTGPLLSIPFALLLTAPADPADLADAHWLLRDMTIAHVPSAANFVALRKAGGSHAPHPWFGFGGFHPVTLAQAAASFPGATCRDSAQLFAGLPPLPFAQRELDAARALTGASPSDELTGAAFTVAAVERMDLREFRVLHFATHALLPAELRCENQPAIVTSDSPGARDASGALLTAGDVVGLDLDANLVVLSACNTGGPGNTTSGDSLSGLARAFFFAGARSMLVTHWSINDQTSAFLVADTLSRMANGATLAEALRGAQLGLIARAGKDLPVALSHPFFWAPFALIGEGGVTSGAARTAMR